MPNVLFVVRGSFPYGQATSARARNLALCLLSLGYNVHVISDVCSVEPEDYKVDRLSFESIYQSAPTRMQRLSLVRKLKQRIESALSQQPFDYVMSNAYYDRFSMIVEVCRHYSIPFIVESCEWYDNSNFLLRRFDPRFIRNEMMIKKGFKEASGFISISRLLSDHNGSFLKPSVRIPTILDVKETEWTPSRQRERIELVYAGNPGRSKELLAPIIAGMAADERLLNKFRLHVYGVSRAQLLRNEGVTEELLRMAGDSVVVHGKVDQREMVNILLNADYAVFVRPRRRSSDAGFPTKLGESMACGLPVIANDTGDISLYLEDGVNGYLLSDNTAHAVTSTLNKISQLSSKELDGQRVAARTTAELSFDYRSYPDRINELLQKAR